MHLNTLKPAKGANQKTKRVGRGIGSGRGKTCGSGHKGQRSRSGGYHKVGFEGGQMPLQRRLPKFGFISKKARFVEQIRLSTINKLTIDEITLENLYAQGLINSQVKQVKIFLHGEINRPVTIKGINVTAGARAAIEQAGGKIIEE